MQDFTFWVPTKVVFGRAAEAQEDQDAVDPVQRNPGTATARGS